MLQFLAQIGCLFQKESKLLTNKEVQFKCKPWINKKIMKLIKEKIKPMKNIVNIKMYSGIIDIKIKKKEVK